MLLPSILFLAAVSASPLQHNQDETPDSLEAVERNFDLLGDTVIVNENGEFLDGDVDESRLLTSGSAGDYTLVSIPWAQGTSLTFNDTSASTLSTLGNAALLVGGLYLLSGFPTAALSDPFGISRRLGQPALPGPHPPPRFQRIQHKTGKQGKGNVSKRKSVKSKRRPIERRGPAPAMEKPTTHQSAQERQLLRPGRLPSLPTLRPLRPLNFRMPELPSLRMPSLPNLRRPSFPQLNNPFRRPAARPRPVQQFSRPRPAPASTAPASSDSQSSAPPAPSFRPSSPNPPVFTQTDSAPIVPVQTAPNTQSAPLTLPNIRPAAPSDFGGAFDNDPFSEFQSADFGSDASFRELINQQFGESFDLQRLPSSRSDKDQ